MTMPKAAIHKNNGTVTPQHNIWRPRKRPIMQPESKPHRMESRAD
jgi:hypothetical protein